MKAQHRLGLALQAFSYEVGVGGYLTSMLVRETAIWILLLRRSPGGIAYAFSPSSERTRYQGLPPEVACLEKRGLVLGPAAYALSRWRARRAAGSR